jgi:hypothetical protein
VTWKLLIRGSARGPWGLLGAVVLALVCEMSIERRGAGLSSVPREDYKQSRRQVEHVETGAILCLGDSLVKYGVSPKVLEARLGRPVINAAVVGGTAPYSYFMLQRVLERGARPALVIVDFKPTQLQSDPRLGADVHAGVLHPRECLQFALTLKDPRFFGWLLTLDILPSARARNQIRSVVSLALAGQENPAPRMMLPHLRNWSVNQGAWMMEKNPNAETTLEHWDEKAFKYLGGFHANLTNAEYVRKFLSLAEAHDVPVYWIVPPVSPRLRALRDEQGADLEFVALLRRVAKQHPKLTVVDGQYAGYPARVFSDGSHLDVEGAYTLSESLAALIQSHPAGAGRWLELPPYRPVVMKIPLEDVEASRKVVFGDSKTSVIPQIASPGTTDTPRR